MASKSQTRMLPAKSAGLTNILNKDDRPLSHGSSGPRLRDSGFYSTNEASSRHTSATSFIVNGLSPSNSGYQSSADKTPSPVAANMLPQTISPSASNMSVASMVSPNTPGSMDQRRFDRPTSLESSSTNGATLGEGLGGGLGARRESVDSRINQGFSDMRLGGSPYTSNNQSTSSIQSTLHSQRNPRPGLETLALHRISNGYQPNVQRNPEPKIIKTAPTITGPTTSHIARAAEPTKGQAWAFPEEDIQRVGSHHYDNSRRSSITESIASSQFTTESRLPMGQRRLDDGSSDYRVSTSDYPSSHHHHHSMQHKQLNDLQHEEGGGATGSQPYSRTPELRVSHKLAERKRRTEMKELFDQLRDLMPQERGSKASKWEILTKGLSLLREEAQPGSDGRAGEEESTDGLIAIAEHQRQADHIRVLQSYYSTATAENEMLRRELQGLRMESAHLRGELNSSTGHQQAVAGPGSQAGSYPDQYSNAPPRNELPPLRAISNGISNGPDSMTGIQYEGPRTSGYRSDRY